MPRGIKLFKLLSDSDLNISQLDNHNCSYCHKKIPVLYKTRKDKNGVETKVVDRSNRIDCDNGKISLGGVSPLETYHIKCWRYLVFNS